MADATLAEDGYCLLLDALLSGTAVVLRLYTNDPDLTTTRHRDDFVEASGAGYSPLAVKGWTPSVLRNGRAFSAADTVTFTVTGTPKPAPIVGYYATFGRDGPLLWAWRRPGDPFTFTDAATQLQIACTMRFPCIAGD